MSRSAISTSSIEDSSNLIEESRVLDSDQVIANTSTLFPNPDMETDSLAESREPANEVVLYNDDGGSRSLWLPGGISILWLFISSAIIYSFALKNGLKSITLNDLCNIATLITTPLIVLWLVVFTFTSRYKSNSNNLPLTDAIAAELRLRDAVARLRISLGALEGAMEVAENRANNLHTTVTNNVSSLVDSASTLNDAANTIGSRIYTTTQALDETSIKLTNTGEIIVSIIETARSKAEEVRHNIDPISQNITDLNREIETTNSMYKSQSELISLQTSKLIECQNSLKNTIDNVEEAASNAQSTLLSASENFTTNINTIKRQSSVVESTLISRGDVITTALNASLEEATTAAETRLTLAMGTLDAQINDLEARSHVVETALQHRGTTITQALDQVLERASQAAEATHNIVTAQVNAIETSLETICTRFDVATKALIASLQEQTHLTGADVETLCARFIDQCAQSFKEVEQLTTTWKNTQQVMSDNFKDHFSAITQLESGITSIQHLSEQLPSSLSTGQAALAEMDTALQKGLEQSAQLTAHIEQSAQAAVATHGAITVIADRAAEVDSHLKMGRGSAQALQTMLLTTIKQLHGQLTELNSWKTQLDSLFSEIEPSINAAKNVTEEAVFKNTNQLVSALSNIRTMAAQASQALKDATDGMIENAHHSLKAIDTSSLGEELTVPFKRVISDIEDLSRRSIDVTEAAVQKLRQEVRHVDSFTSNIEKRVTEAQEQIESAARQDLSRAASLLIESMSSAAIDIAKMLSLDISDTDWDAYLRGDRSIFIRRTVKITDRNSRSRISKLYHNDEEFRDQVRRYVRDFERLISRLTNDRDGSSLAVILLSSDIGKLYVALAQSISRLN